VILLLLLASNTYGQIDYTGRYILTSDGNGIQYDWSGVAFTYANF